MIKINVSKEIEDDFYNSVKRLFQGGFSKKEKKKELWNITYESMDTLLENKLNKFDRHINFEKLIRADYIYMKSLVDFLGKNPKRYALSKQETEYFLTMYKRLKKAEYIKKLNIAVCPYCNRNYIFNFSKNNKQNATAQLDHFFDKKKYPYLAVSMYNLVPSCSTCNQRKSSKQENIFYPYLESFNDCAQFKFSMKNTSEISLKIEAKKEHDKVEKHIEVFNLEKLYNEHKDIVLELIQKREIYPDSYIDDLLKQYEGTFFNNREDILRLITCGYVDDKDLHKRPLSKLIKDISEELELI
jgi:hypothetical protein